MAKKLPTAIYNFIVADSVRQEITGKITIIGAFAVGNIIIGENQTFPVSIPLAFVISFRDGTGAFNAAIQIYDPNGNQAFEKPLSQKITKKDESTGMQLLMNISSFQLTTEGDYRFEISLDEKIYHDTFTVSVGPLPKVIS